MNLLQSNEYLIDLFNLSKHIILRNNTTSLLSKLHSQPLGEPIRTNSVVFDMVAKTHKDKQNIVKFFENYPKNDNTYLNKFIVGIDTTNLKNCDSEVISNSILQSYYPSTVRMFDITNTSIKSSCKTIAQCFFNKKVICWKLSKCGCLHDEELNGISLKKMQKQYFLQYREKIVELMICVNKPNVEILFIDLSDRNSRLTIQSSIFNKQCDYDGKNMDKDKKAVIRSFHHYMNFTETVKEINIKVGDDKPIGDQLRDVIEMYFTKASEYDSIEFENLNSVVVERNYWDAQWYNENGFFDKMDREMKQISNQILEFLKYLYNQKFMSPNVFKHIRVVISSEITTLRFISSCDEAELQTNTINIDSIL